MDITTLAKDLAAFLVPFMPYLLKAGEKAFEKTGEQVSEKLLPNLGKEALERAQALWARLSPKAAARPALQEATKDVAAKPDDDAVASLRLQLKKLLSEDAMFANEIAQLMGEDERDGIIQNVIQRGKYNINIGKADQIDIGDKHQ